MKRMTFTFESTTATLLTTKVRETANYRTFKMNVCFVFTAKSITSKFYSKYDAINFSAIDDKIVKDIKNALDRGPREKYSWPVTENQW